MSFIRIFAVLLALAATACVTGASRPNPGEPDESTPDYCNVALAPAGAEHDKCVAHNRALNESFNNDAKQREPWFNFAPDGWAQSDELEERYVVPVTHDEEATAALEKAAFLALSPADVLRFTGKEAAFAGRQAFLVRALVYFKQTGSFHVFQKDESILVQHDSVGVDLPAETRAAVVVFLPQAPRNVYVDCGLLE